jgi:hypothetical protein
MYIYPIVTQDKQENGMDERVKLLRRVCRSQWFRSISRKELKLYLLLLVSTGAVGQEGRIAWGVLKRSLGRSLTVGSFERLANVLRRFGLVRLRLSGSSQRFRGQRGGSKLEARFTVLRSGGSRDPRRRRSRQQGEAGDG